LLQRGRGPETADGLEIGIDSRAPCMASTGPRSGDRGWLKANQAKARGDMASTGPRSGDRGWSDRAPAGVHVNIRLQRGRGPETADGQTPRGPITRPNELQRGRGPETADGDLPADPDRYTQPASTGPRSGDRGWGSARMEANIKEQGFNGA